MTRNRTLFFIASLIVVVPLVAGAFVARAARDGAPDDSFYKYLSVFTEVLSLVRQSYVETADVETLMDGALDGIADALDPFSLYVPAEAVDGYTVSRELEGRHSGLMLLKDRGYLYVVAVEEGSPGEQAGVKVADIVAELNGESTRLMPLWQAQRLLAQKAGSKVAMRVLRLGEMREIEVELGPFQGPRPNLRQERGVGVLRVASFDDSTAGAVAELLRQATDEGQDKLLLDLRGVAWGSVEAAYDVAGLFASGNLGQLRARGKVLETFSNEASPRWTGELAVLVDRSNLGASEILATILHQQLEAKLVGERTFGHAGRLGSVELSSGGRLLFTEAFYAGPDGEPHSESLSPDLQVMAAPPVDDDEEGDAGDPILERGVELLLGEVESAEEERKAA